MDKRTTSWIVAAGCLAAGIGIGFCISELRNPVVGPVAPDQIADQAREVLGVPEPFERSIRWSALLERATPEAMPALRDAVASAFALDTGDPEVLTLGMWWAGFDPKAALEWTDGEWRAQSRLVVGAIFRVWAYADPEAAVEGIAEVPEFHHDAALDSVIAGWQASGKPGLVERAASITDDTGRQRFSEKLARRLVLALGTEEAMRWLETLEDPAFRQMMSMRVASAASEQGDAAAIADWAAARVTVGDERPSGFPRRIGTRWVLRDPVAALAWLAALPPGIDRDDGVMETYRDWVRYAPGAALQWIQNAELERWSEPAFSIYARMIAKEKPGDALALVARFSDEQLRMRVMTVIARKWAARDPAAANAWLAEVDLPADVKARVSGANPEGAD